MLEKIEKLLGKKVRWATQEEIEKNILGEEESVTYILDKDLSIDTVDQKEDSEEEMYYILESKDNGLSFEFVDYVIVEK